MSPLTGTYAAISMGGYFDMTLDIEAGTLKFANPDIATTRATSVSLGSMKIDADGAYVFPTGFTVAGKALTVRLYRVDDKTLTGVILASTNGRQSLTPVIATRAPILAASDLDGNWNEVIYDCTYDQGYTTCAFPHGNGWAFGLNNLASTYCKKNVGMSACAPADIVQDVSLPASSGGGRYSFTDTGHTSVLQAFTVAGQKVLVSQFRDVSDPKSPYVGMSLAMPEATTATSQFEGSWRAATSVGGTGTATVAATDFTANIDGLSAFTGTIAYNARWSGMSRMNLAGQPTVADFVTNGKLALIANKSGAFLLSRE